MLGVDEELRAKVIGYLLSIEDKLVDIRSFDGVLQEMGNLLDKKLSMSTLEGILYTRRYREKFRKKEVGFDYPVLDYYLSLTFEDESLARLKSLFGDVFALSKDEQDELLLKLYLQEKATREMYDRIDIENMDFITSDFFMVLSLIEYSHGVIVDRKYLSNLLKTRKFGWLEPLQAMYLATLELGFSNTLLDKRKSELERLLSGIDKHEIKDLERQRDSYLQTLRQLDERKKSPLPKFLKSIALDSIPIAIAYNSKGELYILDIKMHLMRYSFEDGRITSRTKCNLYAIGHGFSGSESFIGGVFVDENDEVFVISGGNNLHFTDDLKIIPSSETALVHAEKAVTALVTKKDAETFDHDDFFTVGFAAYHGIIYLVQYNPEGRNAKVIATDGNRIRGGLYQVPGTHLQTTSSDYKPRIKIHDEEIYMNMQGNITVFNLDLNMSDKDILDYLQGPVDFSPGKMDFDSQGRLWVMNKFEGEEFPTIKAYRDIGDKSEKALVRKGESVHPKKNFQYDTFHAMCDVTGALSLREFAIDRTRDILVVTDPANNKLDFYQIK